MKEEEEKEEEGETVIEGTLADVCIDEVAPTVDGVAPAADATEDVVFEAAASEVVATTDAAAGATAEAVDASELTAYLIFDADVIRGPT